MKVYFYSEIPAYLKVDSNYVGTVNKNYCHLNLSGNELLEFIPTTTSYLPYTTCLNCCDFFKFYDGILIICNFTKLRCLPYKLLFNKTYHNNFNLSVFSDGCVKFNVSGTISVTDELPFIPTNTIYQDQSKKKPHKQHLSGPISMKIDLVVFLTSSFKDHLICGWLGPTFMLGKDVKPR